MAYRLRSKGLPRLGEGGHGDLHVRIHVWTPTKLTAEQRKLFEKLSEVEDAPPEKESGSFGHPFAGRWATLSCVFCKIRGGRNPATWIKRGDACWPSRT